MHLLLCAATEFEIKPTIDYLKQTNNQNVDVLITGVGLTAATYALTKKALKEKPDFILQAGVAGSLNNSMPLTKVVVVEKESIGDLGTMEDTRFSSIFDLNLENGNRFPWTNQKLSNNMSLLKQSGLPIVDSVTVNQITTDFEMRTIYEGRLKAQIETMEGAALHYVALMENIPFLQMRSISNYVGDRDKKNWELDNAIVTLNNQLKRTVTQLLNP